MTRVVKRRMPSCRVRSVAAIAVLLFGTHMAAAQGPPEVFESGVVHAASFRPMDFPGGRVAPGSIISIFGRNLHSGEAITSSELPLPNRLGPLAARVMVNDTLECPLFFVSEGQINCQLPHDLVGEQARLRVVHSGGQSNQITIRLTSAGFGMFARNANGRGPLVVSNIAQDPNVAGAFQHHGPQSPARPGQFVVLWGSGLGESNPPIKAGEAASGAAPAVHQPRVFIGDRPAMVQYAGRAPGFAGVDQINVMVPDNAPYGCAVPVRVETEGQSSNTGTMAVSPDGTPCRDPFEDISGGSSHGSIVLSSRLGRLGPGQLGPMSGLGGPFPHDDDHGPGGMGPGGMGPGGNGHGPGTGFGGGVGPGPGGVGPDGIGPLGIVPGAHLHTGGMGLGVEESFGPDVATARFVRLNTEARMDIGIPPAASNSCGTYFQPGQEVADMFIGPMRFLDAGELTVTGPGVNLSLDPRRSGMGVLYAASLPRPLEMGAYSVTGSGGADVGAFGPVNLTVPPLLELTTSLSAGTEVSRQNPLTLAWVGGDPEDLVVIHGRSFFVPQGTNTPLEDPFALRSQAFVCSTTAGARQFTIPGYVLGDLPPGLLVLNVTQMPSEKRLARFEAPGLEQGGVFRWINTTTYLDLMLGP